MTDESSWGFETKQIHSGAHPDQATGARSTPIYQTTAYTFDSVEHARGLFSLTEPGNVYTRITNPTQAVAEARLAALAGGTGALLVASGTVGDDVRRAEHRPGRRSHRLLRVDLRWHLQPVRPHLREAGHRGHLHRRPGRPGPVASCDPPEHEAVPRGDDRQPPHQRPGHQHGRRHRP